MKPMHSSGNKRADRKILAGRGGRRATEYL